MTPEEIKETIEGMLQVQKELQQTQIKQSDQINKLIEQGREQDRRIQQLVGYSITQGGDILDVQMSLRDIYARLSKLEDKDQEKEN